MCYRRATHRTHSGPNMFTLLESRARATHIHTHTRARAHTHTRARVQHTRVQHTRQAHTLTHTHTRVQHTRQAHTLTHRHACSTLDTVLDSPRGGQALNPRNCGCNKSGPATSGGVVILPEPIRDVEEENNCVAGSGFEALQLRLVNWGSRLKELLMSSVEEGIGDVANNFLFVRCQIP